MTWLLLIAALAAPHPLEVAIAPSGPMIVSVPLAWDVTNAAAVVGYDLTWSTNGGAETVVTLTNAAPLAAGTIYYTATNLPPNVPINLSVRAFNFTGTNRNTSDPSSLTWLQQTVLQLEMLDAPSPGGPWTGRGVVATNLMPDGQQVFYRLKIIKQRR